MRSTFDRGYANHRATSEKRRRTSPRRLRSAGNSLGHIFIAALLLLIAGCGENNASDKGEQPEAAGSGQSDQIASGQFREELLDYAIDNLNRVDEFGSARIAPQINRRFVELRQAANKGAKRAPNSLLSAWPEPEMLRQITDRLNQWMRVQPPPAKWQVDPLVASLPEPLGDLPQVKDLARMEFTRFDGYALQGDAWLRNVANWAKGDVIDDLERAKNLFDWTVRNIQLDDYSPDRPPLFPWETLLFGRGTATERAWTFILLLRQLDIDAALLAVEVEGAAAQADAASQSETAESNKMFRPWCVGALIEGKAYLFDPLLGLPIPATDGLALDEDGQLTIRPATLAEVCADPAILDRLEINGVRAYDFRSLSPDRVQALLEASPHYLSRCMSVLEARLAGERRIVLTTSPSAATQRWKSSAGLKDAQLWLHPYNTIQRRSNLVPLQAQRRLAAMLPFYIIPSAPLFRGRMLYLRGDLVGEDGAMRYLQAARPANAELRASSAGLEEKLLLQLGKQDATYWCGLIVFQRGNYEAAIDYFKKRTLEINSKGHWARGARYNLARSYEASGQTDRAILMYGLDPSTPGYFGNLLRAKWLRELSSPAQSANHSAEAESAKF